MSFGVKASTTEIRGEEEGRPRGWVGIQAAYANLVQRFGSMMALVMRKKTICVDDLTCENGAKFDLVFKQN